VVLNEPNVTISDGTTMRMAKIVSDKSRETR
jgi:hypothetical protein